MKKDDAAAAELRVTDSGWLPDLLRNCEVPKQVSYGYWDDDDEEADADPETGATGDPVSRDPQQEAEAA
jgi:ParB family chromosome partitioning protein